MKSKTTFSINQSSMAFLIGMLLCISSVSITVSAQNMQDTIIAHFNLLEKVPQEKLYLHLDKPFYGAGEKIWFKGYLVNAVTHQDNTQSNFIITELVNRTGIIVRTPGRTICYLNTSVAYNTSSLHHSYIRSLS